MKRSGSVALVVMGTAAFAASFAGGSAYLAWSKPSASAQPQVQTQALASPQQNCTTRPDGTRVCQNQSRSYGYHLFWGGWGSSNTAETRPQQKTQTAALAPAQRSYSPGVTTSDTARGGFGTVAHANMSKSAGG